MKYNEIRVYGDSFCSKWVTPYWSYILAKKLNADEVNLAVSGSSIESMLKSINHDMSKKKIKKNSAVIILFTTLSRFYNKTVLDNFPEVGTLYLHNHLLGGPAKEYYDQNEDRIKWWFSELDFELEKMRYNCYVNGLATILSKKYYKTDFFFMFNTVQPFLDLELVEDRENFHLINQFGLNEISLNEIDASSGDRGKYFEFTKNTVIDPRTNHLTEKNLEILADQMYRYMKTYDKSVLDKNCYHKNILKPIETLEQYQEYINIGHLVENPSIIENLKRKI